MMGGLWPIQTVTLYDAGAEVDEMANTAGTNLWTPSGGAEVLTAAATYGPTGGSQSVTVTSAQVTVYSATLTVTAGIWDPQNKGGAVWEDNDFYAPASASQPSDLDTDAFGNTPQGLTAGFGTSGTNLTDSATVSTTNNPETWTDTLTIAAASGSGSTSAPPAGTYYVTVQASGGGYYDSVIIEVTVTAPTVAVTSPANGSILTVGTSISVSATALTCGSLTLTNLTIDMDGSEMDGTFDAATGVCTAPWTVTGGVHTFQATATYGSAASVISPPVTATGVSLTVQDASWPASPVMAGPRISGGTVSATLVPSSLDGDGSGRTFVTYAWTMDDLLRSRHDTSGTPFEDASSDGVVDFLYPLSTTPFVAQFSVPGYYVADITCTVAIYDSETGTCLATLQAGASIGDAGPQTDAAKSATGGTYDADGGGSADPAQAGSDPPEHATVPKIEIYEVPGSATPLSDADARKYGGLVVRRSDGNGAPRVRIVVSMPDGKEHPFQVSVSSNRISLYQQVYGGFGPVSSGETFIGSQRAFWVQGNLGSSSMRDCMISATADGSTAAAKYRFTVLDVDTPTVKFGSTDKIVGPLTATYLEMTEGDPTLGFPELRPEVNAVGTTRFVFGWAYECSAVVHPAGFSYPPYAIGLCLDRDTMFRDYSGDVLEPGSKSWSACLGAGNDTSPAMYRSDAPDKSNTIYDVDAPGVYSPPNARFPISTPDYHIRDNFREYARVTIGGRCVRCSGILGFYIRYSTYTTVAGNLELDNTITGDSPGLGISPTTWNLK